MTFLDLCISQELVLFLVLFSDRRIGIRFVLWYWRVSGEMGIERVEIDLATTSSTSTSIA